MNKLYIVLKEDGKIIIRKTKPEDTGDVHGWMELVPCEENVKALARAAEYCDKGVDYDEAD